MRPPPHAPSVAQGENVFCDGRSPIELERVSQQLGGIVPVTVGFGDDGGVIEQLGVAQPGLAGALDGRGR